MVEPLEDLAIVEGELLPPKKRKLRLASGEDISLTPPIMIKVEPEEDDVVFVSASPGIKEELVEPKIEEISEDESEEDEEEEESVWTLIEDWGLNDELRPIFTEYKITLQVLENMTEDDLKVIVPNEQLALRILLRTKLLKWQKFNGYGVFAIEHKPSTSRGPTTSNNWERSGFSAHTSASSNSANEDLLSKDLEDILNTSPKGRQVLDYRFLFSNEPLSRNWRISLCEAIADYCIQHKIVLKNTHLNHLSNEIVRLFPAENKDEYFTPHISKEGKTVSDPCGYLADEYKYRCEKMRKACQPLYRGMNRKRATSPKPLLDNCTKEQYEAAKLWLYKRRQPWDEHKGVVYKWKRTFRYRRTSFMTTARTESIIDQWPILNHTLGYTLIESDFDQIFADKSQALYENWDRFCTKIIPLFRTDIKDSLGFDLYKQLERLKNKEMRDCIFCQLINSVLMPTELIPLHMTTPEGKKKFTVWKPTPRDARSSFYNLENSEENAKTTAMIMARRYKKVGLIPQPLIFGIGFRDEDIKQFLVIYHNITYTVDSFLKALNIVFKLYHVINLEYNKESQLMWLFIQKYFFDIVRPYDLISIGVNKLMSRLR